MDEDCDKDDIEGIDWSETAYMLPEPYLITEKSFKEHVAQFTYKEYFNFVRGIHGQPTLLPEQPPAKSSKLDTAHDKAKHEEGEGEGLTVDKSSGSPSSTVERSGNTPQATGNKPKDKQDIPKKGKDDRVGTNYHKLVTEPRRSSIYAAERHFYHNTLRYQKAGSKLSAKIEKKMKLLIRKLGIEQTEYQQFLYHASLQHTDEYIYLDPHVKECVVNDVHDSVLKLLPSQKKFKMVRQIDFPELPTSPTQPFLTFMRRVHKEGTIPRYRLPDIGTKLTFDAAMATNRTDSVVNEDIILTMCKSEGAHFYLNNHTLISIMEGLAVDTREWLLPFEIKQLEMGKEEKEKVITFGEPLPRRVLSTREVNDCYLNNILKRLPSPLDSNTCAENISGGDLRPLGEDTSEEDLRPPGEELVIDTEKKEEDIKVVNKQEANIHVNVFALGDFKVLLETTVDRCDHVTKKTSQLSPKCEYQFVVGFEQFSVLELCRTFWDSHIANTDYIVCSRVDIRNDDVTRNDVYTRDILCPPACPYKPRHFCNQLHQVFTELRSLDPGGYILEHAVGHKHLKVLHEGDEGLAYDVLYEDILGKKEFIVDLTSPWLPIDTAIIPEHFMQKDLIPCIFDPHGQKGKDKKKKQGKNNKNNNNNNNNNNNKNMNKKNKPVPKKHIDKPFESNEQTNAFTWSSTNRTVTSYSTEEF